MSGKLSLGFKAFPGLGRRVSVVGLWWTLEQVPGV